MMKLNRIKTVLVEKDLSQKWLSEQIGKSFSTTNAYCCNRQQPNLETLYKIAQLLSVELKELIVDVKIQADAAVQEVFLTDADRLFQFDFFLLSSHFVFFIF